MLNTLPQYTLKAARKAADYVAWRYVKNAHESVFFYTFHKCASTLFSYYVLKNIHGLRHVDYASRIYGGKHRGEINFKEKGFVYGPIRLSCTHDSSEYKQLVEPTCDTNFIKDRTSVFLIRDPRDILVSSYYSFGYTHGLSPVEEIRALQLKMRTEIQSQNIDEYVMNNADRILAGFLEVAQLNQTCTRSVVLKYEDMVEDWDGFANELTRFFDIKPAVLDEIYRQSRPREKENVASHRRSGKPGGFRAKLNDATITALNASLKPALERFKYAA